MSPWKWLVPLGVALVGCGTEPVPCQPDILVETLGIIEESGGTPALFSTIDSISAAAAGQAAFSYLEGVVIQGQPTNGSSIRLDIPLAGFLASVVLKLQVGGALAANEVVPVDGRPEGNPGRAAALVPEASGRLEITNLRGNNLVARQGTLTVLQARPFRGRWVANLDGSPVATNTRLDLAFTSRSCPR